MWGRGPALYKQNYRNDEMVENLLSLLSISIVAIGKYSLKVLSNDKGGGS
jgi:hypothetical protein